MTRAASPKLGGYVLVTAVTLLGALVFDLPELVAVAAPFALVVVVGLALAHRPAVDVELAIERERVVEGDEVEVVVGVSAERAPWRLELFVSLEDGLELVHGRNPAGLALGARDRRELRLRVRCARWGSYLLGTIHVRAQDALGLFRYEGRFDRRTPLRAYPRPDPLRRLLRPLETQVYAGNQVARQKGDGLEFADLRPFQAGDRIRRVNWRASARRGELWVNERHPERNADVVLFVDSFAEARRGRESTLDLAVRAAAGLAGRYLGEKDRVGFVSFGGVLNWLLPSTGLTQLYRIVDSLLDTEIVLNYAWRGIDVLPRRTLPPHALVVALTPLLDERTGPALLDLRGRGFDLVVIEVSPLAFVAPGPGAERDLAHRIWRLRRQALRTRYERAGVPVAVWDERTPLAAVVEGVRASRRFAPRVRA